MEFRSNSTEDTEAIGAELAQNLKSGDILVYTGDLGAGKTAFTRGLGRGLGIPDRITSPTFAIVNEYEGGRIPLFHFDLYRLSGSEELYDIGWEDYLTRNGICAVEWSERMADMLPEEGCRYIEVALCRGQDDDARIITVRGLEA